MKKLDAFAASLFDPYQSTDLADLLAPLGDKVIVPAEQKAKELEKI